MRLSNQDNMLLKHIVGEKRLDNDSEEKFLKIFKNRFFLKIFLYKIHRVPVYES